VAARPKIDLRWPPNRAKMTRGSIGGSEPNNNAMNTIAGVTQDEPTRSPGNGDTPIEAVMDSDATALLGAIFLRRFEKFTSASVIDTLCVVAGVIAIVLVK
jgi:hypothetical protein